MRWLVLFLLWIIILLGSILIGYNIRSLAAADIRPAPSGVLGSPVSAGSVRYGCAPHGPVF